MSMTSEEIIQYLDSKTAEANSLWSQIEAVEINSSNKSILESMCDQMDVILNDAKVVHSIDPKVVMKHGYCVARTKYVFRIGHIRIKLKSL